MGLSGICFLFAQIWADNMRFHLFANKVNGSFCENKYWELNES